MQQLVNQMDKQKQIQRTLLEAGCERNLLEMAGSDQLLRQEGHQCNPRANDINLSMLVPK